MDIAWTILIGFCVGLLARAIVPGRDTAGFLVTTILGMSGAILGALIGRLLGVHGYSEPTSIGLSIVGAVILLLLYRTVFIPIFAATR